MSISKKIYVFTPYFFPSSEAGGPVISLKHISKSFPNRFVFLTSNFEVISKKKILENDQKIIEKNTFGNLILYFNTKNKLTYLIYLFKNLNFSNTCYLNSFFSLQFSIIPLLIFKSIIISPRGEFSPGALKKKTTIKLLYIKFFKIVTKLKDITFHSTSKHESEHIRRFFKYIKIIEAPNMSNIEPIKNQLLTKSPNKIRIIFISRILDHKNLKFVISVISKIQNSDLLLTICGNIEDSKYWEYCKYQMKFHNINYEYKGIINNQKVQKEFSRHHLLFLPTKGENFGHVISESLQSQCPVLISNLTPWRNLERFNCGWDLSIDDEKLFVDKLNRVVSMSQNEFQKLRDGCLKAYNFYQNQEEIKKKYDLLFN